MGRGRSPSPRRRYRSRSPSDWRNRSRSRDRGSDERYKPRRSPDDSRSRRPQTSRQPAVRRPSKEEEERIVAEEVKKRFDEKIQDIVAKKVALYVETSEFKGFLEDYRRRKREEIVGKIDDEIEAQRLAILTKERERLEAEIEEQRKADALLREQRRLEMEEKERADALKLLEVQKKLEQEEAEQRAKRDAEERQRAEQAKILGAGKKMSMSLKKNKPFG